MLEAACTFEVLLVLKFLTFFLDRTFEIHPLLLRLLDKVVTRGAELVETGCSVDACLGFGSNALLAVLVL